MKCIVTGFVNASTEVSGLICDPVNLIGFINCPPPPLSPNADNDGIVDVGSYADPQIVSTNITFPSYQRVRVFIQSNGGVVTDPTITDGFGTQELYLFGTSNTNPVQFVAPPNMLLSGPIQFLLGTIASFQWVPRLNKYVEVSRNEIY